LDDKEKLSGCLKLAEYWASRHDARREFEWKIALGWWGLLVLATRYVHSSFFQMMSRCEYAGLSSLVALVLLLSFVGLWLYPVWKANMCDMDQSFAAAGSARGILLDPNAQPTLTSRDGVDVSFKRFARDWNIRFQTFTTLVLLVVLCIAVRY
jgi:hypothetical protein